MPPNKCNDVSMLKQIMTEYDGSDKFYDKYADHIVTILNHFHHLLSYHDMDDDQFNAVFTLFGGECSLNDLCFNQTAS